MLLPETTNELNTDVLIDVPLYKLYSIKAITLATFFGGILPGGFMMAQNFKELNENNKANITWLVTAGVVVLMISTPFIPALDSIPSLFYSFFYTILAGSMARKFQSASLETHQLAGGSLQSTGKIVLICVIGLLTILLTLFGIYYLASLANTTAN